MTQMTSVTVESVTVQVFLGLRYYRCGRYFQRKGRRLHLVVWAHHFGPPPAGCHIHHADGDRANNQSWNLRAQPRAAHLALHASAQPARGVRYAAPAAAAWHGSPAGIAWHRERGRLNRQMATPRAAVCEQCGRAYESVRPRRFCSPRWRQTALRRRRGARARSPA
jgi:hypothetical protein